jgi:hypothetical protein
MIKKIKDQKIGKIREKRKAKMTFKLRVEIPGKFSTKNFGQEILWERKKKNKKKERIKTETKGKS